MRLHLPCRAAVGPPLLCPLLLQGQQNCCPPPFEVVVDCPAANQADVDGDCRQLDNRRLPGGAAVNRPPILPATRQQNHGCLLVVVNRMATNKADVMRWWSMPHHQCLSGSRQLLPFFSLTPPPTNNVAPPPTDEVSPSSPTSHNCRRCTCQGTLGWCHAVPSPQGKATTITTRRGT